MVPNSRLTSSPETSDARTTAGPDHVGRPTKGVCWSGLDLLLGAADPCDTSDYSTGLDAGNRSAPPGVGDPGRGCGASTSTTVTRAPTSGDASGRAPGR